MKQGPGSREGVPCHGVSAPGQSAPSSGERDVSALHSENHTCMAGLWMSHPCPLGARCLHAAGPVGPAPASAPRHSGDPMGSACCCCLLSLLEEAAQVSEWGLSPLSSFFLLLHVLKNYFLCSSSHPCPAHCIAWGGGERSAASVRARELVTWRRQGEPSFRQLAGKGVPAETQSSVSAACTRCSERTVCAT